MSTPTSNSTAPSVSDPAANAPVGSALRNGAISPRQALFFALTALGVPVTLSGFGATLAFSAGNGAWLAVLIGTAVVLLLALVIVRFSRRHLATGSIMSYLNLEIGPRSGVLGGAALFVGYIAATMLFLSLSIIYLVSFLVGLGIPADSVAFQAIVAVVLVLGCVLLARRGVSLSVNAAVVLGWIGVPLVVVAMVAALVVNGIDFTPMLRLDGVSPELFLPGIVLAIGAFAGFEGFTALAQETAEPRRTIPKLVIAVVLIMGGMALLSAFATTPIVLSHADDIIAGASPLSVLATAGNLGWVGSIADVLLFVACVGSLLAYINDAGRIIATAARDGYLPSKLGLIDPRRSTPSRAIVFIGVAGVLGFIIYLVVAQQPIYSAFIAFAAFTSYAWTVAYVALAVAGVVDGVRTRSWLFAVGAAVGGLAITAAAALNLATPGTGVLPWLALGSIAVLTVTGILARRRSDEPAFPVVDETL